MEYYVACVEWCVFMFWYLDLCVLECSRFNDDTTFVVDRVIIIEHISSLNKTRSISISPSFRP